MSWIIGKRNRFCGTVEQSTCWPNARWPSQTRHFDEKWARLTSALAPLEIMARFELS